MIRGMIAGISHATVVGVSGAIIGSLVWGTASVPFTEEYAEEDC